MNKISRMSELPKSECLYPVPSGENVALTDDSDEGFSQVRAAKSRLLARLGPGCEAVPHRRGDGTIVPVYFIRQGS